MSGEPTFESALYRLSMGLWLVVGFIVGVVIADRVRR